MAMPLDSHARADGPVAVPVLNRRLGPIEFYRTMQRNILELVPEAAYREPILSGRGRPGWHMVMEPSLLEHVLKTREDVYPRSDVTRRIFRPTRGENILVSYGKDWRRQHKAVVPSFQHRNILNVAPIMTSCADAWTRRFAGRGNAAVDVYEDMIGVTCDIICDAALSGREQLDRERLAQAVGRYLTTVSKVSVLDLWSSDVDPPSGTFLRPHVAR
jgi:cytochrome P450